MSFDPIAYTGEDGSEYKIHVIKRRKTVLIDWTKDDHEMFSGLFKEIGRQMKIRDIEMMSDRGIPPAEHLKNKLVYQKDLDMPSICQNCGLEIMHKAYREWGDTDRGAPYLGGLGEMCKECVKPGDIDSSKFPF